MKRINKARKSTFNLPSLTLEGALFLPDLLEKAARGEAILQSAADYQTPKGLQLRDEYSRAFQIANAQWKGFTSHQQRQDVDPYELTCQFVRELLKHAFGYHTIQYSKHIELDERRYPVNLQAGSLPIVVAPFTATLDESLPLFAVEGSGSRKKSAFQLAQELLNASPDHHWALVTNGRQIRLLHNAASLTRPSFLEIDLQDILQGQRFSEFASAWRLLHASRAPNSGLPLAEGDTDPQTIWAQWRQQGQEQGTRVRDGLRHGVEQALIALGQGFLEHPDNQALRTALDDGSLSRDQYFQQLLRLVYRLIFVFTLEERGLLHPQDDSAEALNARQAYAEGYALARLRELCLKRRAHNRFDDHWQAIRIVFRGLQQGQPLLALPALGGLFAADQCPQLDQAKLSNQYFLTVIRHLRWAQIVQGKTTTYSPVDYRNMGPEELGSVYESLLELVPSISLSARRFGFVGLTEEGSTAGNARKLTGSYYTPDSLVQELIKSALEPVIAQRLQDNPENPAAALLSIRVIDPACGSGHFLLAAARRLAEQLAELRSQASGHDGAVSPQDYRHALRQVVTHCIFGVDRNPMAIELARMALWLEGFEEGRPLGFLNHHLQVGDALLGLTDLSVLEQGISKDAYKALSGDDKEVCKQLAASNRQALKQLETMQKTPQFSLPLAQEDSLSSLQRIESLPQNSLQEIAAKESAWREFLEQTRTSPLRNAADMLVAAYLLPKLPHTQQQIPTTASLLLELISDADSHNAQHLAQRQAALDACQHASVFHWPLAFPQVFAQGGFDCVLGNPPWERIKLQEEEFFASRSADIAQAKNKAERSQRIQWLSEGMLARHLYPELAHTADADEAEKRLYQEFVSARRTAEAASIFVHVKENEGGRYPLTGVGDVNTYALFAETILQITKAEQGFAGFIVPTGIATDASTKAYFANLTQSSRLVSLYDFDNSDRIFPAVATLVRFSLVTIGESKTATFAFLLKKVEDINDNRRRFTLSPEDFRLINPNTLTCPVFRSKRDAELTKKLYRSAPVLMRDAVIEGEGKQAKVLKAPQNPWGISFMAMFHMSNDSHLFLTSEDIHKEEKVEVGNAKLDGYLPLYEAKMMTLYDHRFGSYPYGATDDTRALPRLSIEQYSDPFFEVNPRFYVNSSDVKKRLGASADNWFLCFRSMSNHSNVRRFISSVLPFSAIGNSLILVRPTPPLSGRKMACLIANLGSIIIDVIARWKVSGTNLNLFFVQQFPVLPPDFYSEMDEEFIVSRVVELTYTTHSLKKFAEDLGFQGAPFSWSPSRRLQLRAELDAYYARLYGLTREDLCYILDPSDVAGDDYPSETFRVLKEREVSEFGEYRTRKLVLEAWDKLKLGELA
ncbi:Eco57I restriction-modification methylase domain-containing protein [Thiopseudomonas denitrificans]|uniref:site-specific DNA-methyltransferase (adenine-specific) n=1 Tax=Thiopseudomonas denitrificans TaxID=1501432 RepID=A0A4R6TYF3_9GAMM|nr:N-6 DNA methylase [Thiopseudomonas denitrificans]TDQ38958.1 N-6 DNA methylase [Thiopseudomonas denitrificans]